MGIGYGFGVGLFVQPSAVEALQRQASDLMQRIRPPPPVSASLGSGKDPIAPTASTLNSPSDVAPRPAALIAESLPLSTAGLSSSLRHGVGLPPATRSAATDPDADLNAELEKLRAAAGSEPLEAYLYRALLRQQEELQSLQDRNDALEQAAFTLGGALCEVTFGRKEGSDFCEGPDAAESIVREAIRVREAKTAWRIRSAAAQGPGESGSSGRGRARNSRKLSGPAGGPGASEAQPQPPSDQSNREEPRAPSI